MHKARGWKRTLKGLFDTKEAEMDLLVTGSARLNVYPSPHFRKFLRYMPGTAAMQVIAAKNTWLHHEVGEQRVLVASAAEALACLV